MGLTGHLSDTYDAFSSSWFSFPSLLSPMNMSLMNMTMKVQGLGPPPVHALFHFSLKIPLVVRVAQNPLIVWVLKICWSCQWYIFRWSCWLNIFRWSCQWNIKSWSNRRVDLNLRIDLTIRVDSTIIIESTFRIDSPDILVPTLL